MRRNVEWFWFSLSDDSTVCKHKRPGMMAVCSEYIWLYRSICCDSSDKPTTASPTAPGVARGTCPISSDVDSIDTPRLTKRTLKSSQAPLVACRSNDVGHFHSIYIVGTWRPASSTDAYKQVKARECGWTESSAAHQERKTGSTPSCVYFTFCFVFSKRFRRIWQWL